MYLQITNRGELEYQALTLLGASTKRGDNSKIGEYGSGNKYSIAYFLRNGIEFRVFSGEKEIVIDQITETFREQAFDVITVNGQKTSITTDTGPGWKLWEAIREIYSNALDEGLISMETVEEPVVKLGQTAFLIEATPEVLNFYENISSYFAVNKESIHSTKGVGSMYKKTQSEAIVYRKGIKCVNTEKKAVFDYDLEKVDINETREARYDWEYLQNICKLLYTCEDVGALSKLILALMGSEKTSYLEYNVFSYNLVTKDYTKITDAWREAIPTTYIAPDLVIGFLDDHDLKDTTVLPASLYHDLKAKFGKEIVCPAFRSGDAQGVQFKPASPSLLQIQILKDVEGFFKATGYDINYPIDIVTFDNPGVHGRAYDNRILISTLAFEKGKTWIASIIIEEQIHLKHKVQDKTRAFQDAAIGELITYMQEQNTIAL